jgi:hypothetical protein
VGAGRDGASKERELVNYRSQEHNFNKQRVSKVSHRNEEAARRR